MQKTCKCVYCTRELNTAALMVYSKSLNTGICIMCFHRQKIPEVVIQSFVRFELRLLKEGGVYNGKVNEVST